MHSYLARLIATVLVFGATSVTLAEGYDRDKGFPDLTPYLGSADTIVRLQVEAAERLTAIAGRRVVDCGVELRGHAVEGLRGAVTGEEVTARYTGTKVVSITIGQEYVMFLRKAQAPAEDRAEREDAPPQRFADIARAACAPLRTGLVASTGEAWPMLERWSDEEGETEYWVVPPKGLSIPSRTPLDVLDVSVHMLEVGDQRVTRPDWDEFDGLPPMPSSFVTYSGAIRWDGLSARMTELLATDDEGSDVSR